MQQYLQRLGGRLDEARRQLEQLNAELERHGLCMPWNVVLESDLHDGREVAARVAEGLSAALDYDVPAFARSAAQVAAMAVAEPFPEGVPGTGRLQVAILSAVPSGESAARALAMSSERDLLRLDGADLYWQPHGSVLDTGLDMRALERELGPFTVRTKGTIEQLARRHFAP